MHEWSDASGERTTMEYAAGPQPDVVRALVRTLGVVAIVLAAVGLISVPLHWLWMLRRWPGLVGPAGYLMWSLLVTSSIAAALSVLLLMAGIACLGLSHRGRPLMLAWAYGRFIYVAVGFASNAWWAVYSAGGPTSLGSVGTAAMVLSELERWLAALSFAVVVAVLMRRPEVEAALARGRG